MKPTGVGTKVFMALLAGLGLAGVVYLGVLEARRSQLVPDGAAAPSFEMKRHEGGVLKLEELRGQVVMLDFWATWCPPCREEMPALVKLAKEYESQGLVFLAASRDDGDMAPKLVDNFIRRHLPDLKPYVVYADDDMARAFEVNALPTLYFLDREGKVTDAQRGALSEDALRRRIERALKQQ
ncbi:TlpA disulfide reductase family protein [Myxococcus sp. MISCRS1]|jgi:thiol-disulfide isomerase/thioredoxin|uniref:TlpA family protein disulfide reductase n=1 Tax=Myxococcus TaxID=32 RepID=UPI001CBDC1F3|nr:MULTISPECIES: TlpA disulfide reductase family protein [Myxococcus]MBZ4400417.1 TlpA family protein disulfide reductase [Myxococcus sp. AS-1-15]MBZ4410887.1 TlpA family protein disulfide reductase [Myxococcus sp. XM-1-1-1]MCK8501161.1 TlpA family protein disulfide reductase [Myxococcus fulvus]MCY0997163.1 TlpA disulfide reductase family protein [Myxococcus sp. MISCRS1]